MQSSSNSSEHKAHPLDMSEWAFRILSSPNLEDKLLSPSALLDLPKEKPLRVAEPARPSGMEFQLHKGRKDRLPRGGAIHTTEQIALCLHRFCGHELLAVELMAFALLAFPDAPKHFRKGLANTLMEEQQHTRWYMERLEELGIPFGSFPLYRHFWSLTPHMTTPRKFVSIMNLTLEMANLDFAPHYRSVFAKAGDLKSAALMNQILEDEIKHVRFGLQWLRRWKPEEQTEWETFVAELEGTPLSPFYPGGKEFHREAREKVGLSQEWIESSGAVRGRGV